MARLVYGVHPVREALRAGRVQALFVAEGDTGQALRQVVDAAKEAAVMAVPKGGSVEAQLFLWCGRGLTPPVLVGVGVAAV